MEDAFGKRDDGGAGRNRGRPKRALGNAQGKHGYRTAVIGAKHDANATELIKAIAGEFETGDGRAAARDGLRTQLSGKTPLKLWLNPLKS